MIIFSCFSEGKLPCRSSLLETIPTCTISTSVLGIIRLLDSLLRLERVVSLLFLNSIHFRFCVYIYIYILYITYYIYTIYHILPPASYSLLEFIRYTLYNLHSVNLYSTFKVWFTIKLQKHKSFSFVLYSMLKHTGSAGPNS